MCFLNMLPNDIIKIIIGFMSLPLDTIIRQLSNCADIIEIINKLENCEKTQINFMFTCKKFCHFAKKYGFKIAHSPNIEQINKFQIKHLFTLKTISKDKLKLFHENMETIVSFHCNNQICDNELKKFKKLKNLALIGNSSITDESIKRMDLNMFYSSNKRITNESISHMKNLKILYAIGCMTSINDASGINLEIIDISYNDDIVFGKNVKIINNRIM